MEIQLLERIRQGLLETRDSLAAWLHTVPPDKKAILMGPANEQAVQNRLDSIDHAILEAESKTLGRYDKAWKNSARADRLTMIPRSWWVNLMRKGHIRLRIIRAAKTKRPASEKCSPLRIF